MEQGRKKSEEMERGRAFILVGLASAVIWGGAGMNDQGLAEHWDQPGSLFRSERFDQEKWLLGGKIRDPTACLPRAKMAHDIVTRIIKKDMSREDVMALLGEVDSRKLTIHYSLGECIGYESQFIEIDFTTKGEVVRAIIR